MKQRKYITTESDYADVIEKVSAYCQKCLGLGVLSLMQERMYLQGEPTAPDHDKWRQCWRCKTLVMTEDLKHESKIKGFIEIDPEQSGLTLASTGRRNFGKKETRIKKHKKENERILQDYGHDNDLKQMLDEGKQIV